MGVFQRFERRLEGAVTGTFARVFKSAVQPVEIAAALQREMDNSAQILSREASLVPNDFIVSLSPSDHERLAPYSDKLSEELVEVINQHAGTQNYAFTGPVAVTFEQADDLVTGRFRVRSTAVAGVQRRSAGQAPPSAPPPPASRRMPPSPPPPAGPPAGAPPMGQPPMGQPPMGQPPMGQAPPQPPMGHPGPPVQQPAPRQQPAVPGGPSQPYLEVNGVRHLLEPPGIVLGRGSDADLRITDPGVSRRHAEIRVTWNGQDYEVSVHDLGSTNATVLNGRRIDQAALNDGDQVLLGNTTLVVRRGNGGAPGGSIGQGVPR